MSTRSGNPLCFNCEGQFPLWPGLFVLVCLLCQIKSFAACWSRCYLKDLVGGSTNLKCIKRVTTHPRTFERHYISSYKHVYAPEPEHEHSKNNLSVLSEFFGAFYRFSRPHTIIGTILGITSVSLLPVETVADLSPTFFRGLIKALVSAVCMNIYVVGLNQIFDIKIDKVNKPFLPLASGELSVAAGVTIVLSFCVISFLVGVWSQSPPLLFALLVSFLLGTAYSLDAPLLRWKQHAFLAASCILTVRAILVQLAFFLHMQKYVLGRQRNLTKPVVFATVFMCFFSAVIALFK
ncbi:hypothetical protein HPP92_008842 [Vanilla planifolia]|uniref:Uncharacterized protein n=1 Tax=Vanilla planifolia TaxID=51239 RepID=A0A835V4V8_VANPL|nr:hypothetical protein HPP92_008842 [Vanilla planifolia]